MNIQQRSFDIGRNDRLIKYFQERKQEKKKHEMKNERKNLKGKENQTEYFLKDPRNKEGGS